MAATLGLTPLTLVFFQQVSLVGFLANLIGHLRGVAAAPPVRMK